MAQAGVRHVGVRAGRWRDWVRENDPLYASARHPAKPEKIAASVALIVIAAVTIFLILFDWNWLKGPIGRWATARYDREIAINGDLDVNLFSWTPSAVVNGLRIAGPDWAAEAPTADIGRIEGSVRLRKLFLGQIEMPLLSITAPDIVLIATEDGKKSWKLDPNAPDDGPVKLPPIQQLVITEGRIRLDERQRGMTLDAAVTAREAIQGEGESGFSLAGKGSLNGAPLTLTIEGGPFINIRRDRPYSFTAELAGAGSTLTAEGAITRPFDFGQFNAQLSLRGQNMADLYTLTGITAPNTPPYRLAGALSRDGERYRFADFTGRVGSSDLSGDVTVDQVDNRLRVEASLRSRSLDIDDLATVLGGRPTVTGSGDTVVSSGVPGRLLPDAPLDGERLQAMDGTLSFRAASVKRNALQIRQVRLDGDLQRGILKLDPIAFTFSRGTLTGNARIDARRKVPYSSLDFRLAGYPLESIIPSRNGSPTVSGRALGRAKLEGPGASIHDMAANAKGSISLVVPQGQMRQAFAELLGINVGRGLFLLLSKDSGTTPIRCGVADFDVSGGVARARTLVIDTEVVVATGSGTINLGTETMNLKIDGGTKQPRLLRVWAPITVNGSLSAPQLGVETSAVAAQVGIAGLLGALVNPLAALLPFVDPGLAKDANCGALIAGAR